VTYVLEETTLIIEQAVSLVCRYHITRHFIQEIQEF